MKTSQTLQRFITPNGHYEKQGRSKNQNMEGGITSDSEKGACMT